MAEQTTKEIAEKEVEKIRQQAEVNEAYFVGLLWANPINYQDYLDRVTKDEFIHDVWGFYFYLGEQLVRDGVQKFDEITVNIKVREYGIEEEYKNFGKMKTIKDVIKIVGNNVENIEYYFETIKKNYVIRQLVELFGEKVLINKGKYDYTKMNAQQLVKYWEDKINRVSLINVNKYEVENLYIDPEEFIARIEREAEDMLPFYNSNLLNSISQGVPRGHITMVGGFGGTGKSSFVAEKFLMSCIDKKEKTMVVLNEEGAQMLRQKIVLNLLYHELYTGIDRKRFTTGKLNDDDKKKIKAAFERWHELTDGEESLIKVVFMEKYLIDDLEKIIKFYANRGYTNLIIDTHKVSDNRPQNISRWETFVEDTKRIYQLTRKEAGGLNLRTLLTFQLADSARSLQYLDFEAIGEGKAAKNEASIVFMFRPMWAKEYDDLKAFKYKKPLNGGKYIQEPIELDKDKTYYLLFTPKNRFGLANDVGQPVLILEPILNASVFKEVGWCFVANNKA